MKVKKRIAIVGGGKEGLSLLPLLDKDPEVSVELIVENNPEALVFKLNELGFRLARKFSIRISNSLDDLLGNKELDLIIDASSNPRIRNFLRKEEFESVEIISELSARLLWGYRGDDRPGKTLSKHSKLLASLNEIVEAVNLTKDKKQVSSLILKVAIESTGADNGSLMLLDPDEKILKVEVAEGIDPEIVPSICCPLGEGIAGKVALEGKPLLLSGKADDRNFRILRDREEIKSALCVPLIINGSTVGVLNLNNLKSIEGFTKDDLDFITKLAAFDAEILIKSQEYKKLLENAETFKIWKELNQILSAATALEDRLLEVCRSIAAHFPESVCSIYLFDRDTKELSLKASSLKNFSRASRHNIHLREGIDGWAASEQEVVILKAYPSLHSSSKKAFMSIPLVAGGMITGVMNIQLISPRGLSEEEETLLRDVARHLSGVIKGTQKQDNAYIRATKIEAINEAGINILSVMNREKLLELIPPSASMIMDADGCILRLRERDGRMKVLSTYSMWDDEIQDKVFELDAEICDTIAELRRPVHIPDLGEDETYEKFGRLVKSVLALPLMDGNRVLGAISIYDKIPKGSFHAASFSEDDLEIFKKFVNYVEKAMANIRESGHAKIFLNFDKLTGLPNESAFRQEIENEINRARRYDRWFILVTLLWSSRKGAAHQYDVETRNNLIVEMSEMLKENIREYDTLARRGPQKFGILFPESSEDTRDLGTRLTRAIRRKKQDKSSALAAVDLDLKFGFAVYPEDGTTLQTILEKSDRPVLGAKL
ncbi:MAG: GAF domain-containing protein [bacterium]|nr:GAF domain-containing protein [bacterium]